MIGPEIYSEEWFETYSAECKIKNDKIRYTLKIEDLDDFFAALGLSHIKEKPTMNELVSKWLDK